MAPPLPLAIVVDDDAILRMLVSRSAGRAGFEVEEAPTLSALQELLERRVPDLVVLDLNLAEVAGTALLERLAELGCSCPIVPLSGMSLWELTPLVDQGRAMGLLLLDPIQKPVTSARLTERLQALLP